MKSEKQIQNEIMRWLATLHDVGRFFEADVGLAKYEDARGRRRAVQFGTKGQGDIWGIVNGGLHVEIEVKKEDGRQSKAQKNFERMIVRFGGLYILARSVDDVRQAFIERDVL